MAKSSVFDTMMHRFLRIPYGLHVKEFQSPKKPRETIVFIHGIGNTLHAWDDVVKKMPKDIRLIGIDLLGFGGSPRPHWTQYNAKTQARSVGATLLTLGLSKRVIIVGHSLGALVAVEVARRYPFAVKQLILANPPFYSPEDSVKSVWSSEFQLRRMYRFARKHPEAVSSLAPLAVKLGVANKSLTVTKDTIGTYMATLESSIINQTALKDIRRLSLPIKIIYGTLDPVVIGKHIVALTKAKQNITAKKLLVGHEIIGPYTGAIAREINEVLNGSLQQR